MTSLRSPADQFVTSTRCATLPECASELMDQVAMLLATLAPACWKHTGSAAGPPPLSCSSDGFFTRFPVVGSGGAWGGTPPPVASSRIVDAEQRWWLFM